MVTKGEPLITIFADKSWKLTNAMKNAEKDIPIIVEGMLLERVQTFRVV
jgi:AMP phosphorylase